MTGPEEIVGLGLLAAGGSTSWFKSPHRGTTSMPIDISLHPPDAVEGGHLVLNVGGYVATVFSRRARALSLESADASTSRPILLATTDGDGGVPVEVGVLLLARREVQFKRNHLWHLRSAGSHVVPEPFRTILARGRSGTL